MKVIVHHIFLSAAYFHPGPRLLQPGAALSFDAVAKGSISESQWILLRVRYLRDSPGLDVEGIVSIWLSPVC